MKNPTQPNPLFARKHRPLLQTVAGLALAWLGLQQIGAQATLPFYEPFPGTYVNGEFLGSYTASGSTSGGTSGIIWNIGNSLSSSCARVQSYAALQYPSLVNTDATAQSYGLVSYYKDTSSTKDRGATLAITAGQTLYASCLINVQYYTNTAAYPEPFLGLGPGTTINQSGAVAYFNASGQLLVAKNSLTPATNTTYSMTTSNTHLVVLRYKYNPGAPDEVALWLDPTALGNNSLVPPPNISTTNNANVPSFGNVAYFQLANPSVFFLDEIRVGYNWSDVTPTNAAPGKIYAVSGGGSGCAGDSFAINLSGSDAGLTYNLYTNGVFNGTSLAGTGSAISFTGQNATALYTVLATNTTSGGSAWMSGNATISVLALPNIATQPASVVVATNGLAAMTVYSSGSGLNYQWYRNGVALTDGGHISGSQTATLVISPATVADAATKAKGYFVIVANRCGNGVVSITNSLTLDAAANLVWYGDGISNLWDLASSTNWNFNPALGYGTNVFNYGDNVTLDDSSPYPTVILTNANLSPALLKVDGTQNYSLTGGTLTGPGSILMNSVGSLSLNIANNQTGGIVISNGIVSINSPVALGFGPVTLAGGQLNEPGTGLITITNSLVVTGDGSVLGINSPGGQPLVLTAPPAGLGGSLTLQNITTKNASTAYAEFTAPSFTFNLPLNLINGGGTMLLGGFNISGTQMWNGIIAGTGMVWRNAGGGTTLLNNTNTYSGITKLSNGSIGVGASSVASTPPTIDAGPLGTSSLIIDTGAATMALFASGGAQTVANPISYSTNLLGSPLIIGGANNLTLAGVLDLSGTNRVIQVNNTADTILSGDITDYNQTLGASTVNGLSKTGTGRLYVDGINDFTGTLTNSAGLLAGSGTVAGPVVVLAGATLGAGDNGLIPGTITLNGGLTLGGNGFFRVNKSLAHSNDLVAVTGGLANTGTGTITITNVGPALKVGDAFTLFSALVAGGNALTVSGAGVTWNNHLSADGGVTVSGIISSAPPVFLGTVVSGNNLVSSVSNGAAGSTYYVLATTNLALPLANWTRVATNVYPGGVFYLTNTINSGVANRFYILSPTP